MCGAPHAGGGGHTTSNWARVAVVLFGSASTARPLTHFGMPSRRGGRLYFYCTCCGDGEEQLCCRAAPAGTLQMGCIRLQFPANRCPLSPRFWSQDPPMAPVAGRGAADRGGARDLAVRGQLPGAQAVQRRRGSGSGCSGRGAGVGPVRSERGSHQRVAWRGKDRSDCVAGQPLVSFFFAG